MDIADTFSAQIEQTGIVAALRCRASLDVVIEVGDALQAAPLTTLLISPGSTQPWELIAEMEQRYGDSILLGAGPLANAVQAAAAIAAGARFIVSSHFDAAIDTQCRLHRKLYLPGVQDAETVQHVLTAGWRTMVLFPAHRLSTIRLRQIRQRFPAARCMVMGGVKMGNLAVYAQAGATAAVVRGVIGVNMQWRMHEVILHLRRLRSVWEEKSRSGQ